MRLLKVTSRIVASFVAIAVILTVAAIIRDWRQSGRFRPVVVIFGLITKAAPGSRPRLQKSLIRAWYGQVNRWASRSGDTFFNYGYVPPDQDQLAIELLTDEEPNRSGIQLYFKVIADSDLRDKDVLEVGCGRGGGASFVFRFFQPRSLIGVDLSPTAIEYCNSQHRSAGLRFRVADAEDLPFPSSSFDVVINVESSHNYPVIECFLREVHRVLRPGGRFAVADFRWSGGVEAFRKQFETAGFHILQAESITAGVARSLELRNETSRQALDLYVPRTLRPVVKQFLALKGSEFYESIRGGQIEYVRFVARAG